MFETETAVTVANLVSAVAGLKSDGFRLVAITCLRADTSGAELLYHFDRNFALAQLRLTIAVTAAVPSITPVFFAAVLAENEIQDLFGLRFQGLLMDYGGTFYLEPGQTVPPFRRPVVAGNGDAPPGAKAGDSAHEN